MSYATLYPGDPDPAGPPLDLIPAQPGWEWIIPPDAKTGRERGSWPIVGWHVYREASTVAIPVLAPTAEDPPDHFWVLGYAWYEDPAGAGH